VVTAGIQFLFGHNQNFLWASCGAEGATFAALDFDNDTTFRHAFLLGTVVKMLATLL
jgi:hypothetical protein